MSQSYLYSFYESLLNVGIGYFTALGAQLIIFPAYGIHINMATNIYIGLWFMLVSIIRSYCIRRWFNGFKIRKMV